MRQLFAAAVVTALAFSGGVAAFAQSPKPSPSPTAAPAPAATPSPAPTAKPVTAPRIHRITGSIEAFDPAGHIFKLKTTRGVSTFHVASDLKVWVASKSATGEDLTANIGAKARVSYTGTGAAKIVTAIRVTLTATKPASPSPSPTPAAK